MKCVLIASVVLMLSPFSPSRAADSDVAKSVENAVKLRAHDPGAKGVAYKSDGVDTTSFATGDILQFHAGRVAAFIGADGAGITRRMSPKALYPKTVVRRESEGKTVYVASFQELIGVANHAVPAAYKASYILENVNEMGKAKSKDIPLRKLNAFETAAIETLKAGRDLVVDEQPGTLRVVGAIRASRDCMSCHDCKANDLLGAFTYVLTPQPDLRRTIMQQNVQIDIPSAKSSQQTPQF